jgi:CRISPR-associated endonuclease Cas2
MYYLVFYDIEKDRLRTKLAKHLEAMGLVRLQYSVFIGNGNTVYWSRVKEKVKKLAEQFNPETDSCCFLYAEEKQVKAMKIFGKQAIMSNFIIENPDFLII